MIEVSKDPIVSRLGAKYDEIPSIRVAMSSATSRPGTHHLVIVEDIKPAVIKIKELLEKKVDFKYYYTSHLFTLPNDSTIRVIDFATQFEQIQGVQYNSIFIDEVMEGSGL